MNLKIKFKIHQKLKLKKFQFNILVILNFISIINLYSQNIDEQPFVVQETNVEATPEKDTKNSSLPITRVNTLGKGIYRIKQGNLYGIEVNGELKIPPDYNILQLEYEDYMEATKGYDSSKAAKMGFKGIINSNNDIIIPFKYSVAKINKRYKTVSVCTPKENKLCGICDFNNNFIIPLEYKVPCQSNTINFTKHPSVAYICFDNNHSFLYDSLGVMSLELPFVSIFEADPEHYIVCTSIEGIGVTDSNFNIIIEPIYKSYYWVHKNYMCLGYNKEGKYHSVILDLNDKSIKLDLEGRFDIWDNGKLYHNNSQVYDLNTFQILNK